MKIKDLPINIHIRLWGSFVNRCAYSAILPFVALYVSAASSKSFAGSYLSIIVCIAFICNIVGGYLCDRLPRKKMLITSSYLESASLVMMYVAVWQTQFALFLISYILFSIFSAFRRPPLSALIQDAATPETRKLIYQLDYWLINLSLAIGMTLGGLLYAHHKLILFALLVVSSLVISTVYLLFIEETKRYIRAKEHHNLFRDLFASYAAVAKDKRFITLVIGGLFIAAAELTKGTYIAVRLDEHFETIYLWKFKIDGIRAYSIAGILNTMIVVLFSLPIGKLIEKREPKKVLLYGLILYSIGYIVLTSTAHFAVIIISVIIATIGEIIYAPLKNAEKLALIPADKRGSYQAFSAIGSTGADLTSKLMLIVGTHLNPLAMSGVMLIITLIGSICMMDSFFNKKYKEG